MILRILAFRFGWCFFGECIHDSWDFGIQIWVVFVGECIHDSRDFGIQIWVVFAGECIHDPLAFGVHIWVMLLESVSIILWLLAFRSG